MVRCAAFLFPLILAACGSAQDAELAAMKDARSVLAEWSAVERHAAAGRVTGTYAGIMRRQAREALAKDRQAIKDPALSARIGAAGDAAVPSPDALAAAGDAVEQAEAPLEDR
jgi:hypothetical protein